LKNSAISAYFSFSGFLITLSKTPTHYYEIA